MTYILILKPKSLVLLLRNLLLVAYERSFLHEKSF